MASAVGKYAANKFLKKQMKNYAHKNVESEYDPYFAMIPDPRRPGKFKKVKKQIPTYIPEHDAMILASVRKTAYRLDMSLFNLFGIRFGWDGVIGLVPAFGDAIGVALAIMLFRKASSVEGGLDSSIRIRMIINIILDFVVGLVPFIGDVADAAFKCNTKNVRLLEEHLDKKYKPGNAARGDARDRANETAETKRERQRQRKSGIYEVHNPPPATVFEDSEDDEVDAHKLGPVPAGRTEAGVRTNDQLRTPAPAR